MAKLELGSVLNQRVDQFDLLFDGLKLFGPGGEGEWRFLLLLFLLLRIFFGFLLRIGFFGLRVLTNGVVLKHFEDFAGLKVTLHLTGEMLTLL